MFISVCFNLIVFIFGIIIGASIVFKEAKEQGYGDFVDVKGSKVRRWRWSHEMENKEK